MAGKDGIKRRYGRNALSEWFEADIGQENNCRAAIVCDGRPFCGKGELRPGLTAGADRAAFDRVWRNSAGEYRGRSRCPMNRRTASMRKARPRSVCWPGA